jgi:hypothetical protein
MTRLIRRRSMERLELYDLDKFTRNYQTPPPLPPPRKYRRRPSVSATLERYQFLCNMTRSKTDPIYAATPMFTTIPQTSKGKHHRKILGSYVRLENVKPVPEKAPESEDDGIDEKIEKKKIEEKQEAEDDGGIEEEDDKENDENDDQFSSSSSSSSGDEEKEIKDDDDNKGVLEQMLNRNKKD